MKRNADDVETNDGSTGERIVLISKSGGRHQVDRNMLHRASGYFQGLVNSGMKDANYGELTLEYLTNESLIEVRDYLSELSTNVLESRGSRSKSLNKVEAGLDGAFYLQINDMIDSYIKMLLKHLKKSTLIRIFDIVKKYVLNDQVAEKVIEYMLKNFKEITEMSKILSTDDMFRLVASNEINADSEIEIFNLIIKWISKDQSRKCFAEKLLTEVRYSLMTTTEKEKCAAIIHDMNINISCSSDKDTNISRTIGKLFAVGSTKKKDGSFFNILPVYDFVEACKTGGKDARGKHIKFNPSGKRRPPCNLDDYNACVVDNCLYLAGGKMLIYRRVFVYNPVTAVWSECCSMHVARRDFYLAGLAGHLYAVSGNTTNCIGTATVEKYIPSENLWHVVEPLPLALPHLAGCVCNGTIYVSGSYRTSHGERSLVYQYDPSSNKWFPRAPMLTARHSHVMTCTGNKIFVFGGLIESICKEAMDGEMYDVESDQWSSVLKLKYPVYESPSITINNCLYIFQHELFDDNLIRRIYKFNLAKFLKEKKTSHDSSLSSVHDRNANNNLVKNEAKEQKSPCADANSEDDCQVFRYTKRHKGKTPFDCLYVGVMVMSDI